MIFFPCDSKDRIGKKYMYLSNRSSYFNNHIFLITSHLGDDVFYATDLNDNSKEISLALAESIAEDWTEILPERLLMPCNRLELITRD